MLSRWPAALGSTKINKPKIKNIQLRNIYKYKKMILQTGWLVDREMFWQGDKRIKNGGICSPTHPPAKQGRTGDSDF
jgi:hypothetical protein